MLEQQRRHLHQQQQQGMMLPCPPPQQRRVRGLSATRAPSGRKRTLPGAMLRWIVAVAVALVWMKQRRRTPLLSIGCAKSVRERDPKRKSSPLAAGRNRVLGWRLVNSDVSRGKRYAKCIYIRYCMYCFYPVDAEMGYVCWARMDRVIFSVFGRVLGDGKVVGPLRYRCVDPLL